MKDRGEKIKFLWEGEEPSDAQVERLNEESEKRRAKFTAAAEHVASNFAQIESVKKVFLFGSVAAPPYRERYSRGGSETSAEVFHLCADIDLAVWIDDLRAVEELRKVRINSLAQLLDGSGIGVAHHQVDAFILDGTEDRYLGRLCVFGRCPAGKYVCGVSGCGDTPFLRLHEGFNFSFKKYEESHPICLYREAGSKQRA